MDLGHWQYSKDITPDEWFGFIYKIIDNTNNMEYIGKKQFTKVRRKVVKNKIRRTVITSESDWKTYTSSSVHLNDAIKQKGKENFTFIILSLHKSKSSLSYAEAEAQFAENVLRETLPDGSKKFYNKMIYVNIKNGIKDLTSDELESISFATSELISQGRKKYWQRFFDNLNDDEIDEWKTQYCRGDKNSTKRDKSPEEYQAWKNSTLVGGNNPMYGRSGELSPRYGKSPFENFTEEQMDNFRKKVSDRMSGENNPRYGKSPFENFTEEQLAAHKKMLSEKLSGENNPMYGKPCTYKMSDDEIQTWKENIRKGSIGKKKSEVTKQRMKTPKGPQQKVVCPHCSKEGGVSNMQRYHFDNCKKISR